MIKALRDIFLNIPKITLSFRDIYLNIVTNRNIPLVVYNKKMINDEPNSLFTKFICPPFI